MDTSISLRPGCPDCARYGECVSCMTTRHRDFRFYLVHQNYERAAGKLRPRDSNITMLIGFEAMELMKYLPAAGLALQADREDGWRVCRVA